MSSAASVPQLVYNCSAVTEYSDRELEAILAGTNIRPGEFRDLAADIESTPGVSVDIIRNPSRESALAGGPVGANLLNVSTTLDGVTQSSANFSLDRDLTEANLLRFTNEFLGSFRDTADGFALNSVLSDVRFESQIARNQIFNDLIDERVQQVNDDFRRAGEAAFRLGQNQARLNPSTRPFVLTPTAVANAVADSLGRQQVQDFNRGVVSIANSAIGVGETGLSIGTSLLAQASGGLTGAVTGLLSQDSGAANYVSDYFQETFSYVPRTDAGQRYITAVGEFGQSIDEVALQPARDVYGEFGYERGGAVGGTAGNVGVDALATLASFGTSRVVSALRAARSTAGVSGRATIPPDEFVGPLIGRSGFRSTDELSNAFFQRYQRYVDRGYQSVIRQEDAGSRVFDPATRNRDIGSLVDDFARVRLRRFLRNEGLTDLSGNLVAVNRRLYNPAPNANNFRIPDLVAGNSIFDASLAAKTRFTPQIIDFLDFLPSARGVTIIRPAGFPDTGNVAGSFSIIR